MSNAPAHILNAARATNRTDPDTGRLEPYARASVGQVPLRGEMIPDWEDTQPQARREGVVRRMIRVENERGEGRREREAMRKRERRRESGRGGEEWDEDEGERTLVGKRLVGYLLGNRVVERGEFVGRVGKRGVEGIEAGLVGKGFAGECFARGEDGEWEVCCGCCDEMVCGGEGEGRVKRKEGGWVLGGCCLLGAVCWECFEEVSEIVLRSFLFPFPLFLPCFCFLLLASCFLLLASCFCWPEMMPCKFSYTYSCD